MNPSLARQASAPEAEGDDAAGLPADAAPRGRSRALATGFVMGGWLALFPIVDFLMLPRLALTGDSDFDLFRYASPARAGLLAVALLLCGPLAILAAWSTGVDLRRLRWLALVALANAAAMAASLFGVEDMSSIVYVALVFYTFASACIFASSASQAESAPMQGFFCGAAVGVTLVTVVAMIDRDAAYGRFWGHNAPNYWGAMGQCVLFGALCLKRRSVQLVAAAVALTVMLWAQSRGGLFGLAIGGTVVFGVVLARSSAARATLFVALLVGTTIALFAVAGPLLIDKVLFLNDASRGVNSGATGRAEAWAQAFQLFADHPLTGVGYRQSDQFITAASSAHNAYLATLAETGLLGMTAYLTLIGGGIWRAGVRAVRTGDPAAMAGLGYLVAFAMTGLFERRALNTGNAGSLMMIFVAAWMWRSPLAEPESRHDPCSQPADHARPGPGQRRAVVR